MTMLEGFVPRLKQYGGLEVRKWFLFAFICFLVGVAAAPWLSGLPNGSSIPAVADSTVVQTPALCASRPECHVTDSTLNMVGTLSFVGLPEAYVPGSTYDVGIDIVGSASTQVYGFELATFFQGALGQAGDLEPVTQFVGRLEVDGYQLLTHLQPLTSGSISFRWTAPISPTGPVVFRVASNAANGNFSNTGDHIRTLDAIVQVAETSPDADGDGVDDTVEDGAPNGGDGNQDGTLDRLQNHVASLADPVSGQYVTLEAPEGVPLAGVRPEGNPAPAAAPLAVAFPIGFFAFLVDTPSPGGTETVRVLLPETLDAGTYFSVNQGEYENFAFDGDTGAEIGEHEVTLHLRDGGRGDGDESAGNGQVSFLGGAGLFRELFYFPQVGLGQDGATLFTTDLVFVNSGGPNSIDVGFFNSNGEPLQVTYLVDGVLEGPTATLSRQLASGSSLAVRLSDAGALRAGYARVVADRELGATAVFSQLSSPGDVVLYQAGVPATSVLSDFSLAVRVGDGVDTGLALVNASQAVGATPEGASSAHVTLRLYDANFQLQGTEALDLPAGQHLPRFVTQLFPQLAGSADFFGSITVASDQPLAAVTLQQTTTPTLTTFPVVKGRADAGN